ARRLAGATPARPLSSRHRNCRSLASLLRVSRTRRSPRNCSCPRAPSNATSATSSPNSRSRPAPNWLATHSVKRSRRHGDGLSCAALAANLRSSRGIRFGPRAEPPSRTTTAVKQNREPPDRYEAPAADQPVEQDSSDQFAGLVAKCREADDEADLERSATPGVRSAGSAARACTPPARAPSAFPDGLSWPPERRPSPASGWC